MKDKNIMEQSDEEELYFKMLQELIYLGNSVWDHNWNWTVTKQEIDYSEEKDGMFEVAVASFVNIVIKPTGLERQNMGYGYSSSSSKSMAYFLARKISIVNALQETLLSFNESITDKIQSYKLKEKCATTVFPTSSNTMVEASHNIRSENLENKNTNINKNNVLQRSHNSMINSLKTITSNVRIPTEITTAKPNLTAVLNKPSCTSNINFNKPSKSSDHPTAATSTAIYPQPNQQTTPNRTEVANQMHALNNIRSGNAPTNPFHSNNAQAQTAIFNQNTVQPVRPVLQPNINNVSKQIPFDNPNYKYNFYNGSPRGMYFSPNSVYGRGPGPIYSNNPFTVLEHNRASSRGFNTYSPVIHEWISPTMFHDGFWTESKVKKWVANTNDLIHLSANHANS